MVDLKFHLCASFNLFICMRKVFVLSLILSVLAIAAAAQMPGGGRAGGGNPQAMNIGHLYGKILDKKTNKPIDGVSVQFIQNKFDTVTRKRKDTVLAGMFTDKKGEFSFDGLPLMGNFRLLVTTIGYNDLEQKVAFE